MDDCITSIPRPASGTVHWIGTGRSTGSGLATLANAGVELILWGRDEERIQDCLRRTGVRAGVPGRRHNLAVLASTLVPGDIVVSMIPASEHASLVEICVDKGAHFVCTSYASEAIRAFAPAAQSASTVVLTEAGLDPGIDHLLAHDLIARAQDKIGDRTATVRFTSYCGGVPAVPNDFRYRFSWAPLGVLTALRTPARFIAAGKEQTVDRPWEHTRSHVVEGETFEVFPNRDSIPFIAMYNLPSQWRVHDFVRGTLRLDGWRNAWSELFSVIEGDPHRIAALATELAQRYPMTSDDRDRVVLSVDLVLCLDDGESWADGYLLDLVGDDRETAMARCVSQTAACAVKAILEGRISAGLACAAYGSEAQRWLQDLTATGIGIVHAAL